MKEHPILFSAPMVRAILEGRKTQTRRIVKPQPEFGLDHMKWRLDANGEWDAYHRGKRRAYTLRRCPYGLVGDRLWVRETWRIPGDTGMERESGSTCTGPEDIDFAADSDEFRRGCFTWRPSIFMPRWASRITLEVTGVCVERLQEISAAEAREEGCPNPPTFQGVLSNGRDWYRRLWDEINAKRAPWSSNPLVWVVEFKRIVL